MFQFFRNLFLIKDQFGHSHGCMHCDKLCKLYSDLRMRVNKVENHQCKDMTKFMEIAESVALRISLLEATTKVQDLKWDEYCVPHDTSPCRECLGVEEWATYREYLKKRQK